MNQHEEAAEHTIEEIEHTAGNHAPVGIMIHALVEALDADMEQGAHWMNEQAHAEFKRKYPRFTTLLSVASHVDWDNM